MAEPIDLPGSALAINAFTLEITWQVNLKILEFVKGRPIP